MKYVKRRTPPLPGDPVYRTSPYEFPETVPENQSVFTFGATTTYSQVFNVGSFSRYSQNSISGNRISLRKVSSF